MQMYNTGTITTVPITITSSIGNFIINAQPNSIVYPSKKKHSTVLIDSPNYTGFDDSGLGDSDDVLIQPNHCIIGQSPHGLLREQKVQLIQLIHRYNTYKIDIKVSVNKDDIVVFKSWRGRNKLLYRKTSKDDLLTINNVEAIKYYEKLERVHWFNFVYCDLCKYIFREIMQPDDSLGTLVESFRRELFDNIEPGLTLSGDKHPITYLYNLVFNYPVKLPKPRMRFIKNEL